MLNINFFIFQSNDGQEFGGSLFQKFNPNLETGVQLAWTAGSNATWFGLGCKYQLDSDSSVRVKINNASQLGLGYQQKLREGVMVTLSTLINVKNFNQGGHKLGPWAWGLKCGKKLWGWQQHIKGSQTEVVHNSKQFVSHSLIFFHFLFCFIVSGFEKRNVCSPTGIPPIILLSRVNAESRRKKVNKLFYLSPWSLLIHHDRKHYSVFIVSFLSFYSFY